MGDDVVQLRLSLNEETVKQVQNRIQNIVNKLNNRRVNILLIRAILTMHLNS